MEWNTKRIEEVLPQMMSQIKQLQPSKTKAEDKYIWQPLATGIYSTKSGYYAAASQMPCDTPQSSDFSWIKDVWNGKFSPKMRVFIWSVIQKALPFGQNLQTRGINSEAVCVRCKEQETACHTFFHCPFAKEVWSKIPIQGMVHLATEDDFKDVLVAFRSVICLPPSGITNSILPWICWSIWKARNILIFENRTLSPVETATNGIRLAREWNLAQPVKEGKNPSRTSIPTGEHRSNAELQASPICKSDAAWNNQTKKAGLAWIINGPDNKRITQGIEVKEYVFSPLIAEALALRAAISTAVNLDLSGLRVFSDNITLIRAINNDMQAKEIYGIVNDIQRIASAFVAISFSHLNRKNNVEADCLAKQAL
ncbi:unnamed protein product, partial [Brassica rapa]